MVLVLLSKMKSILDPQFLLVKRATKEFLPCYVPDMYTENFLLVLLVSLKTLTLWELLEEDLLEEELEEEELEEEELEEDLLEEELDLLEVDFLDEDLPPK